MKLVIIIHKSTSGAKKLRINAESLRFWASIFKSIYLKICIINSGLLFFWSTLHNEIYLVGYRRERTCGTEINYSREMRSTFRMGTKRLQPSLIFYSQQPIIHLSLLFNAKSYNKIDFRFPHVDFFLKICSFLSWPQNMPPASLQRVLIRSWYDYSDHSFNGTFSITFPLRLSWFILFYTIERERNNYRSLRWEFSLLFSLSRL